MNRAISQRHINLINDSTQASCYRRDVRYVELANAELKRQLLSTAESDDEDQDPWRVCFFEMEPHRDPEQRSTPSDRENVRKRLRDVIGPGVKKNVPEDISAYGKYYGVDRVDDDSDSDTEDEDVTLPCKSGSSIKQQPSRKKKASNPTATNRRHQDPVQVPRTPSSPPPRQNNPQIRQEHNSQRDSRPAPRRQHRSPSPSSLRARLGAILRQSQQRRRVHSHGIHPRQDSSPALANHETRPKNKSHAAAL